VGTAFVMSSHSQVSSFGRWGVEKSDVRQGNLKMKSSCKRGLVVISDSESDDLRSQMIRKPQPYLTPLVEEVKEMWKDIQRVFQITEDQSFPTTKRNFQVSYLSFHSLSTSCYFSRCCFRFLGYQTCGCVVWWRGGHEPYLPNVPL